LQGVETICGISVRQSRHSGGGGGQAQSDAATAKDAHQTPGMTIRR